MANLSNIITPTNVLTASSTNTLSNKTISGASNTITNVPLSTAVTGTLPVANGGTGAASLTANNVLLGNGTSAVQVVAPGTAGNILTSNGTTWQSTAPAAAGGTITATASGAINNGAAVSLNSNGTVSITTATYSGTFTGTNSNTFSTTAYDVPTSTYDPLANAVVVFYRNNSNDYPMVVVGLINGTAITWQTPVVVISSAVMRSGYNVNSVYASASNAHLCFYCDYTYLRYSSVRVNASGSVTVLQGTSTIDVIQTFWPQTAFLYDPATNRLAYFFSDTNNVYRKLLGGTVNSSGLFTYSYGYDVDTTGTGANGVCTGFFDTATSYGILYWQGGPSNTLLTCTVQLGNSSATFGSQVTVFGSANNNYRIAVGKEAGGSGYLYAFVNGSPYSVRYATRSGTTISMGTTAGSFGSYSQLQAQFVTYGNRTILTNTASTAIVTVSSGTPSLTAIGASSGYTNTPQNWIVDTNGLQMFQINQQTSTTLNSYSLSDASSNNTSFVGFSNGAYTNGQTATINVVSATNNAQSGLTTGTKYYVARDGTLSTTQTSQPYAGIALSATNILVKG